MKKRYLYYTTLLLLFGVYSCEKDNTSYKELTDSKEGALVFTAKSRLGIQTLKTYSIEEETYLEQDTVTFNAGIGAVGLPASDINVTFEMNTKVLDSINAIREMGGKKKYQPFPADSYTISDTKLNIPKGKEYSNTSSLIYHPEKFAIDTNYLIAFTITDASGYKINRDVKTVIFVVSEVIIPEPTPNFYAKTGWKVIDISSEETTGEGTDGFAANIIDGKLSSFWHTCWSTCTPEESSYPHSLTIDMKVANKVSGIEVAQRQSGTRGVKLTELLISDDNVTWRTLGEFTLLNVIAPQRVDFKKSESFQYLKMIVKSGYDDDGEAFVALGEVSPFILK